MSEQPNIAIIGGGAAGMFAAIQCASNGCDVTLFEKNPILGKKVSITGKGRCNVTNNCTIDEFLANVCTNAKFLYSAIHAFTTSDTMDFFEKIGVPLKVERGGRVFPVSDKAGDIVAALKKEMSRRKVRVVYEKVIDLLYDEQQAIGVITQTASSLFDRIIICTGGLSYPGTGSTGDGYRFAEQAGISLVPPTPALVPIEIEETFCRQLMGLTIKNAGFTIEDSHQHKTIYEDFGEFIFTHFGLSGPVVLSASSRLPKLEKGRYKAIIDFKPALDEIACDQRVIKDFTKYSNKNFANALSDLLPRKLIPVMITQSGIPPERKVNAITKEERKKLVHLLKHFPLTLKRLRPIEEAIVTSGGVCVKELYPQTMESKKMRHLYFAGEVIDVDAYTGGFNLQIAFSTAYLAAKAASETSF
ncbi:MAG: NAD(P)/FAD-dependent oxidoreductase [Clostridiales bacterium]|nr:NAD(P)/FAD-dependent oxidoreductase [Clostridiales bacterium]